MIWGCFERDSSINSCVCHYTHTRPTVQRQKTGEKYESKDDYNQSTWKIQKWFIVDVSSFWFLIQDTRNTWNSAICLKMLHLNNAQKGFSTWLDLFVEHLLLGFFLDKKRYTFFFFFTFFEEFSPRLSVIQKWMRKKYGVLQVWGTTCAKLPFLWVLFRDISRISMQLFQLVYSLM